MIYGGITRTRVNSYGSYCFKLNPEALDPARAVMPVPSVEPGQGINDLNRSYSDCNKGAEKRQSRSGLGKILDVKA